MAARVRPPAGVRSGEGTLLFDREPDVARIESALYGVSSQRRAVVAILGSAGIGKAALLGAARTLAADPAGYAAGGGPVSGARPASGGESPPSPSSWRAIVA